MRQWRAVSRVLPAAQLSVAATTTRMYGEHMAAATKTTVYLDPADYARIKAIARAVNRAPAELVREAVAEYAARHRPRRVPKSVGVGRSGRGDLSKRVDDLLAGMGRPHDRR